MLPRRGNGSALMHKLRAAACQTPLPKAVSSPGPAGKKSKQKKGKYKVNKEGEISYKNVKAESLAQSIQMGVRVMISVSRK